MQEALIPLLLSLLPTGKISEWELVLMWMSHQNGDNIALGYLPDSRERFSSGLVL